MKALWVLTGLVIIFTTSDWRLLLLLVGVNVGLVAVARVSLVVLRPMLQALVLFGLVILVFQLLFQSGETLLALGPLRLHTQGLFITREVWLRLANLALLCASFMLWTHPVDIALMGLSFGLPYRYAMLGGLALRFFPILQGEVQRIQEAQQVRGQPLHSLAQRTFGLVTVMLPFILRVLRRTTEIALSMELRGYGYAPTRTFSRHIVMRPLDWTVAAGVLAVLILWLFLHNF